MATTDNADVKFSENKVEGEDGSRTANCLRGRLLAERMASRNAREEAEKLEIKLLEVENLIKQEEKSRNRAERKLQFLKQRLEFINISEKSTVEIEDKGSVDLEANTESQLSLWVPTRDDSLALVPVKEDGRIDPVKQVLESLRRAKEQLRCSMERRRMGIIKVG